MRKIDADQLVTWETPIKHVAKHLSEMTPENVLDAVRRDFPVKLTKTSTSEETVRRTLQELEADGLIYRKSRGIYLKAS